MKVRDINELTIEELRALYLEEHRHSFAKISELQGEINKLKNENDDYRVNIEDLKLQLEMSNAKYMQIVSAKYQSQRNKVVLDMPTLFNDVELEAMQIEEQEMEEGITVAEHKKKRPQPKQEHIDYSSLERKVETVHSEIPECSVCGNKMALKKYEETEELVYIPQQLYVKVTRIPVYECVECQSLNEEGRSSYQVGEHPNKLFKRSLASPSLLAYIIDEKYNRGLPLYTIEKKFSDQGVILPRANMTNWILASMKYLEPLYRLMKEDLLSRKVIMADETVTQVLNEEGKPATSTSYMFVYRNNRGEGSPIILYDYQSSRSGDNPKRFLEGFHSILVTDAYSGYNKVEDVTRCMCNIHAIRKFKDAYKLLPNTKARKSSDEAEAVKKYQEIFDIDKKIIDSADNSHLSGEKRMNYIYTQRQLKVKPKFDKFLVWLEEIREKNTSRYSMNSAIGYVLNNQKELCEFMNHGDVPNSNQATEQSIRPFVTVRNRCKFYVSPKGAEASAMIYSMVITAIENKVQPYMYFMYVLDRLANMDLSDETELRKLLPYSDELPEYTKILSQSEIKRILKQNDMTLK